MYNLYHLVMYIIVYVINCDIHCMFFIPCNLVFKEIKNLRLNLKIHNNQIEKELFFKA